MQSKSRVAATLLQNALHPDLDLAMLRLDNKIVWADNPRIRPICLPETSTDYAGRKGIVTKFGGEKINNFLNEFTVRINEKDECANNTDRDDKDLKKHPGYFCAGNPSPIQVLSPCFSDNGGPLIVTRKKGEDGVTPGQVADTPCLHFVTL